MLAPSWVRRSAITRLKDPRLLVDVATHNTMRNIRLVALYRLLDIVQTEQLSPESAEDLLVLLDDRETIVPVIELTQRIGIDWISRSSAVTIQTLFDALSSAGWRGSQTIEHAVRQLFGNREDLREALYSHSWANPYTNSPIIIT